MLLNVHSYYSLRYGTLSIEELLRQLKGNGYHTAVLTDINNSTGVLEYIRQCREQDFNGIAGMEFRNGDTLLYVGIAENEKGFQELNELMTECNLQQKPLPETPPDFNHVFLIYPFGSKDAATLKDHEYIGIRARELNKIVFADSKALSKYVLFQPVTFSDDGYKLHCQLRAIDHNKLLSQLGREQTAQKDEYFMPIRKLLALYENFPRVIYNTNKLLEQCSFHFDFEEGKNKKRFTDSAYDDRLLLEKLAYEGAERRYGNHNKTAFERVRNELDIIEKMGFGAYFLITHDIIRYGLSQGYYQVGRGSGANSVVAYCLGITEVCPIELDLYFERFLNPKRKSPPDFDIDFGWDERDAIYHYIFNRYGYKNTALLGARSTFKDRSIIRELGKVYGLPKSDIDRVLDHPGDPLNKHETTDLIYSVYKLFADFPNLRTIHASGILISEYPLTTFTALDLPPKGFPTAQFDMHTAEAIGFEKFDILSQRGISHIKEAAAMVKKNKGITVNIHDIETFKNDEKIKAQLKSADTIGCFYIESPAMRGLLKKLECDNYLTLVAASSIIRPGVAKSGMMRAYIERYRDPSKAEYLHPIMEEQLKETFGVMVYQEDVLKIGHYFGGLDLADADVLRRMMSGKRRNAHHLKEIESKYYNNCRGKGIDIAVAKEVWRQIESFAGFSFSKAHSASYAVESLQSLYFKTYFPKEFYVAVINNFGGFYYTKIYVNAARKAGASIHLPCINRSEARTTICGDDLYLGFQHVQNLEHHFVQLIAKERMLHGNYASVEDFIKRTQTGLEQLVTLIRINAFRFTGKNKNDLQLEAYALFNRTGGREAGIPLFPTNVDSFVHTDSAPDLLEDLYDEIELLGFPVSASAFDLKRTAYEGEVKANDLMQHVSKTIRILGDFVTFKKVHTARKETMNFGTWLDRDGNFFDTTHFPPSLKHYPLQGNGIYLIQGKVVEEFGFPSIEVEKCGKVALKSDPRGE